MRTTNKKRYLTVLLVLSLVLGSGTVCPQPDTADAAAKKTVLKLEKTKVSVEQGSKVKLKIVQKNIKKIKSRKWSSGNKKIASVTKKGVVSGKKAGKSTTVTCKVKYVIRSSEKTKSKTLKCKVTVKEKDVPEVKSNAQLYQAAVVDSMVASEDEICPLVSLTKDDKLVTWDDQGRVLLCTWHNYPDSYPKGEKVTINWGYVWTYTDKEIATYADELKTAEDPEMRMRQLIGFAPDSQHSTVTAFWVKPEDVLRPAYQNNATVGSMSTAFPEDMDEGSEFRQWFDQNILSSYFYGAYPWTRLGYTYDWADNEKEYGMTEFIVNSGSEVEVEYTETTGEFLKRITNG